MKKVTVTYLLSNDLKLKAVDIDYNDTVLPSGKELLQSISRAVIEESKADAVLNKAKEIINHTQD